MNVAHGVSGAIPAKPSLPHRWVVGYWVEVTCACNAWVPSLRCSYSSSAWCHVGALAKIGELAGSSALLVAAGSVPYPRQDILGVVPVDVWVAASMDDSAPCVVLVHLAVIRVSVYWVV